MVAKRTHTYRGVEIRPCVYAPGQHKGQWVIQTYHPSGTPYADDACPHVQTLATAREAIDQEIAERT